MLFTRGVLQSAKCAVQRRSHLHEGAACVLCCDINHQAKSSVAAIVYDAEPQALDDAELLQNTTKKEK